MLIGLAGAASAAACGTAELSQQEIEARSSEMVSTTYDHFREDLHTLAQGGLSPHEPITVGFSFYAPTKRHAIALRGAIEQSTAYQVEVKWFKEPEEGWFVSGEIPSVVVGSGSDKELLRSMVKLGLRHGCEIRWWQPTRRNSQPLSNYRLNPTVGAVTAVATIATPALAPPAG